MFYEQFLRFSFAQCPDRHFIRNRWVQLWWRPVVPNGLDVCGMMQCLQSFRKPLQRHHSSLQAFFPCRLRETFRQRRKQRRVSRTLRSHLQQGVNRPIKRGGVRECVVLRVHHERRDPVIATQQQPEHFAQFRVVEPSRGLNVEGIA